MIFMPKSLNEWLEKRKKAVEEAQKSCPDFLKKLEEYTSNSKAFYDGIKNMHGFVTNISKELVTVSKIKPDNEKKLTASRTKIKDWVGRLNLVINNAKKQKDTFDDMMNDIDTKFSTLRRDTGTVEEAAAQETQA